MVKDKRLGVFVDLDYENSFIIKTSELVFARANKVGDKWLLWLYPHKLQKTYSKFRDLLISVDRYFKEYTE